MLNESSSVIIETDQSGECGILEEFLDESIQSPSENITNNESSIIIPKKFKNTQRIILDSSDDSDIEEPNNRYSKNSSNINMDSQAEKSFSYRELQKSISNLNTSIIESIHSQGERRSDTLESELSQRYNYLSIFILLIDALRLKSHE